MLVHSERLEGVCVTGDLSGNTKTLRGLCHQVIVQPTTESTTYDFSITDPTGAVIFARTSEIGTLSEFVTIPLTGIYTMSVENSTVDEAFTCQMMIQE